VSARESRSQFAAAREDAEERRRHEIETRPRAERPPDEGAVPPTTVREYLHGEAPAAMRGDESTRSADSYYGYPAVKRPHWKPYIPAYFFVGGLAAGAQLVGSVAELAGSGRDRDVARIARYVAAPLVGIGQLLLILDLGRPERALHMFRVAKTRSPMSLGAWVLLLFSAVSGLGMALQLASDVVVRRPTALVNAAFRGLSVAAVVPAVFVGSYTGTLLSATSVPLWAKARRLLAPMFLASALNTGSSLVALVLAVTSRPASSTTRALAATTATAIASELVLEAAIEANAGRTGASLVRGRDAALGRAGEAATLGALAFLALPLMSGRASSARWLSGAAGLALLGGIAMRFSVVSAGKHSADDPHAYWEVTRR
jgi:formate-dependent nitrite reductase membrane component NrfD